MRMAKTGGVNEYLCLGRRTPATSDLGRRGRTPSSLRQSRCRDPRLRTAYMSASDLADEYDAVMADVIAVAAGRSQADCTTRSIQEPRAATRPPGETVADLKAGSASTSDFIRSLTDEQLELTQEFAWAGTKNVAWVASAAIRHPKGHLKSIKDAVGR